jgi:hypothetical protein
LDVADEFSFQPCAQPKSEGVRASRKIKVSEMSKMEEDDCESDKENNNSKSEPERHS